VGPIITHNFDVLCGRAGLAEHYVRRYDQKIPQVPMPEQARALLVIGLHADRRAVQARARQRGLPVFFLDPEGFTRGDGRFVPYLIEGARAGERVCRQPALTELPKLAALLTGRC
ncbi:hypothetical protein ACSNOI_47195, partial [Actinomadura kijaniata]|uniref:hypothetical protein n=1 Tax=Actinomadura kijaniata TaxID=46161 RepID=UPI003F1DDD6F